MKASEGKWPLGNGNRQYAHNNEEETKYSHWWNGHTIVLLCCQPVLHYKLIYADVLHFDSRCKMPLAKHAAD